MCQTSRRTNGGAIHPSVAELPSLLAGPSLTAGNRGIVLVVAVIALAALAVAAVLVRQVLAAGEEPTV